MTTAREEHREIADSHKAWAARYYNGEKGPQMPDPVTLAFVDQADAAINEEGAKFWDAVRAVERGELGQVPDDQRDHYDAHCGAFAALRTAYEAGEVVSGRRTPGTMVTAEQTYDPDNPPADVVAAQAAPGPSEAPAEPAPATGTEPAPDAAQPAAPEGTDA